MIIVCDIDGTISDCQHRQHLALAGRWEEFHDLLTKDEPIRTVLDVINPLMACGEGHPLILLTGRPDSHRASTMLWLSENAGWHLHDDYETLLMRPKDDWRGDVELKPALLADYFGMGGVDSLHTSDILVFEDREKVVARWRDLGLTCFQVAQGAF